MGARFSLLDCTLRDGGYITNWKFKQADIAALVSGLTSANLDYVEVGYLNAASDSKDTTQFSCVDAITPLLPKRRKHTQYLAMVDTDQFTADALTPYKLGAIDGIRVVFYKHQIEKTFGFAHRVKEYGYKLFVQPMVTVDYSIDEYSQLIEQFSQLEPDGISIVDSFGYMQKEDFRHYFQVIDNLAPGYTVIGIHSHNNMDLAFLVAQDVFDYPARGRDIIIDASLYGMGRGAGNLNTELISDYYNRRLGHRYDVSGILALVSRYIMPIYQKKRWGYSPYTFITGLYHVHPNYACYLLEERQVSVAEFELYVQAIPPEMKGKCKKPYVLELWDSSVPDISRMVDNNR